jgi:phosphocarrier protein
MKEFKYVIRDEVGLHARPAGLLVKEAQRFSSAVQIRRAGRVADGKKLFALMALGVACGDEVTVQCQGEDEDAAAQALQIFFRDRL